MRIEAEAFLGGMQIVVEHHPDVALDAARVVDAVQTALSDALSHDSQQQGVAAIPDARHPLGAQERTAVVEAPKHERAVAEVGAISDLDAAIPEGVTDNTAAVADGLGERSHDALRAQAVELLDVRGLPEDQVCERLGISLSQLRRWDPVGRDELAVSGGVRR